MKCSFIEEQLHNLMQSDPELLFTDHFGVEGEAGAMIGAITRLQARPAGKASCTKTAADDDLSSLYDGDKFKTMATKRLLFLAGWVCAMSVVGLLSYSVTRVNLGLPCSSAEENPASVFSGDLRDDARPCTMPVGSVKVGVETRGLSDADSVVEDWDKAQWDSLLEILPLNERGGALRIGVVGIDEQDKQEFTLGSATFHVFPFERSQLRWSDLFPEWIEEDVYPPQQCPHLPMPSMDNYGVGEAPILLDAVVMKVQSCERRDVLRLQTLLAGATVASEAGRSGSGSIWVVIISPCRPHVNIFPCRELVKWQDDLWLFQVNLQRLGRLLALPFGSCEHAVSLDNDVAVISSLNGAQSEVHDVRYGARRKSTGTRPQREAYATVIHTAGEYVCGAIVAAQSIKSTDSRRDMIALVDESVTPEMQEGLQQAGWQVQLIERIRNPRASTLAYNEWNYSKFRLWQLTQYDKVIAVDTDLLVLRNLDFLFDMPEITAVANNEFQFNSGVMVLEPSNCTFHHLMENINEVESSNGGDQGYLNEIFPWWHRLPRRLNFLKHHWSNTTEERNEKQRLFEARDPPILYVLHYLGLKPWNCYRDYDCNWNLEEKHQYASDAAHKQWWDVHDSMPLTLQKHCLLSQPANAS